MGKGGDKILWVVPEPGKEVKDYGLNMESIRRSWV